MGTLGTFAYFPFYEPGGVEQTLLAVRLKLSGSGYDPNSTGMDGGSVAVIPWSPIDDVTIIDWTIADVFARCETPGSTISTVRIPYYTGTGDFVESGFVDTSGVNLAGGTNESSRPASLALTTIPSGYKVASNWTVLGSGVAGLSVYVVLNAFVNT